MTKDAERPFGYRSGRSLEDYQVYFGPDLSVQPELILDIGAGDTDAGWRISKEPGYGATMIRLDPSYKDERPVMGSPNPIAADVRNLPFADQTFDRVVSSWMFLRFSAHYGHQEVAGALDEILRVVKDGHEVMINPINPF